MRRERNGKYQEETDKIDHNSHYFMFRRTLFALTFTFLAISTFVTSLSAQPPLPPTLGAPGWTPLHGSGAYRDQIRATPIEYRPNRPLHFYGNMVRRIYWGATPVIPVVSRTKIPMVYSSPLAYSAMATNYRAMQLPPGGVSVAAPSPVVISRTRMPQTVTYGGVTYGSVPYSGN